MVGRREERDRLRQAIGSAGSGPTSALAIVGEPGIGKTRLLGELADLGEDAGLLALTGRAAQFEHDVPFAIVVQAVEGYLRSQDPHRFRPLGRERLTELGRIFPSLGESSQEERAPMQAERYRTHYAVGALLELLAESQPVLLAFDDLQWADDASLELVSHLLRRPPEGGVFLALAYRSGESPSRLTGAVQDALRYERLDVIEVGPLNETEAARLIPSGVDRKVCSELFSESGGNPFYLEQLARSLDQRDSEPRVREAAAQAQDQVPPGVVAALRVEVDGLAGTARKLMDGAAVTGDPFDLGLAAAAAGCSDADARDALDELLVRQLAHPTELPQRFRFRHPLVHQAVLEIMEPDWRAGAHRRVRDVLTERGAGPAALAYHVAQIAEPGDEQAITLLTEAASQAASVGPLAAAHWYGAALDLLPDAALERRLAFLIPMAASQAGAGRLEESRSALLEALERLPDGAEAERITLISTLAELETMLGRKEEARQRLGTALAALPDPASPAAATFQCALAMLALYEADWSKGYEWGELASRNSAEPAAPPVHAMAEVVLSVACHGRGSIAEAEEHRGRAAQVIDSLDDAELGPALNAVYHLGLSEYSLGRYQEATEHLRRGIVACHLTQQGQRLNGLKGILAWCVVQLGNGAEATELIEEATDAARLWDNPTPLGWALGIRCWIACQLGDLELAAGTGREAVAIGSESDEGGMSVTVRALVAYACAETGESERCLELMRLAGAPDFPSFVTAQKTLAYEALSTATLELGRHAEAEELAERAAASASEGTLRGTLAAASRAQARVLLARDEPEPAAELTLAAVAGLEEAGSRLDAARTRVLAARVLAAAGNETAAIQELELAVVELGECGAAHYCERAARELRRLGGVVPKTATRTIVEQGVGSLTEREREVAQLVAEAMTNREIGAALYISEKTVEKHLSQVFVKLGVDGRAAVGAKLIAPEG